MPVTSMWLVPDHCPTCAGGPVACERFAARLAIPRTLVTKDFFNRPRVVHDWRRPCALARACSAAWPAPSARRSSRFRRASAFGV